MNHDAKLSFKLIAHNGNHPCTCIYPMVNEFYVVTFKHRGWFASPTTCSQRFQLSYGSYVKSLVLFNFS